MGSCKQKNRIMKKIVFTTLLNFMLCVSACAQLKNDTIMIEKFNYEAVEGKLGDVSLKEGDWIIDISLTTIRGYQKEYAPAKDFYVIEKRYHLNGVMSFYCKFLGGVSFGERRHYDESGNLIEIIDEDKKFGNIKPHDIVDIIEKVGWINRETGENIMTKTILETTGNFYRTIFNDSRRLKVGFSPAKYSQDGEKMFSSWWFFAYSDGVTRRSYTVNGDTGEYRYSERTEYIP